MRRSPGPSLPPVAWLPGRGGAQCPRCHATPGAGMALTEPHYTRGRRVAVAVATCCCGQAMRVYWQPVRHVLSAGEAR
jgi:hypothetical protein